MKKDMPMPALPRPWHRVPKPRPTPRAEARLPGRKVPREVEHWTGFAIIGVADGAQRRYGKALADIGLSISSFIVLAVIIRNQGIVAVDIAERVGLSPQRISDILCEFERDGWIERDAKLNNFAYKGVWASNLGRDVWVEAEAAIYRADHALHLGMPVERQTALRRLLLGLVPGSRVDHWYTRYTTERQPD